jgi:DNA-binding transcriptional LysR family regulator
MELMQLEMFVAVVEEGSVRAAAERVFRTQPAVSIAVSKLEREFEAPLFDRSKRHEYRLTQAGEALYHHATRMLNLRRETISALDDVRNLRLGRLRIGANESISLHLLPKLAQAFLAEHAGIRMEVKCERSEKLLADLKDRKLDLALLSFRPEDKELDAKFILQDELVLISSPAHPFATRGSVHIKDLGEQSLMAMDVSEPSPWHRKIAEAFMRSNAPLHLTVENAPIETIKKMVAIGLGVGFVPLISVGEEKVNGELAIIDVQGFHLERSLWLVRRRAVQSPAAKAFIQTVVAFGENLVGRAPAVMPKIPRSCASLPLKLGESGARQAPSMKPARPRGNRSLGNFEDDDVRPPGELLKAVISTP